jgi:AcrR family transcriptional regulator
VTRRAILEAASATFAESGYEQATIRTIAARAGVDPSLIHHHFGSKEDLFVAANEFPISPAQLVAALRDADGEQLGERITRLYLQAASGEGLESLIRAAMTNPTARAMLREFVERGILDTVERELEADRARLRIGLAASHLIGLFIMRRVVGIDVIRDADEDALVAIVGPTVDRYLGGDLGDVPAGR